jgi:methylated-DNA-[protein]-cysteine S-methyltransferase
MTETTFHTTIPTPVGELLLIGDGERLRGLYMQEGRRPGAVLSGWRRDPGPFAGVREQLDEYFARSSTCPWARPGPPSSSASGGR